MKPIAFVSASIALASSALAQWAPYNDGNGKLWRQPKETTLLTWIQVASVCPQDGVTPCTGIVAGKDLTGWVWATRDQVADMMSDFVPEILANPSLAGSAYTLPGIFFMGEFQATMSYYTTFGGYEHVQGWLATTYPNGNAGRAYAEAQWPVFHGAFNVAA